VTVVFYTAIRHQTNATTKRVADLIVLEPGAAINSAYSRGTTCHFSGIGDSKAGGVPRYRIAVSLIV